MSIATLVLGILSILFIFTGSGIPEALVLGIVGIVLGHFAKKKSHITNMLKPALSALLLAQQFLVF